MSEQLADWPPYLRLQVSDSDLMMGGKRDLLARVCCNRNLDLTL